MTFFCYSIDDFVLYKFFRGSFVWVRLTYANTATEAIELAGEHKEGLRAMKFVILVVLLISLLAMPAFSLEYKLTDLGRGEAFGINDSG